MKGHPATDLTPSSLVNSYLPHILSLYRGPGLLIINGKPAASATKPIPVMNATLERSSTPLLKYYGSGYRNRD